MSDHPQIATSEMAHASQTVHRPTVLTLGQAPLSALRNLLTGDGLHLHLGATSIRVQSELAAFGADLRTVYHAFPLHSAAGLWADIHVRIRPPAGLRRWLKPQAVFEIDASTPFEPFASSAALPLFEWGSNWVIGQRLNHWLLFHAGVLERHGKTLLMPALPGSGKSTLTAALSMRGFRLMSDEFGAYDPQQQCFRPMLKPAALKNQSIDVIRRFDPQAVIGPLYPGTRKGTVAHLAALPDAVARRHQTAAPGAIILPRWLQGEPTTLTELDPTQAFSQLSFNAFNYNVCGEAGFRSAVEIVRNSRAWHLVYSDLDDAVRQITLAWDQLYGNGASR